jgi:hypothetical protein
MNDSDAAAHSASMVEKPHAHKTDAFCVTNSLFSLSLLSFLDTFFSNE